MSKYAAANQSDASKCSLKLPTVPSGGGCQVPRPDCFQKALPQLGTSVYRDTIGSSEMAFASRYSPSYFSSDAVKAAAENFTQNVTNAPNFVHPSKGPCASQQGGGSRRKRLNKKRKSNTRRRSLRRRGLKLKLRTRRSKRRGGGYYLDLSSSPHGGRPSTMGYDDTSPPYFGKSANAKGAPCEPRTYSKGNVGLCDSRVHKM